SSAGVKKGAWVPLGLSRPEDIATDGTDVWVVDAGLERVLRYAGAAARLRGTANPTSSFALQPANTSATGVVRDAAPVGGPGDSRRPAGPLHPLARTRRAGVAWPDRAHLRPGDTRGRPDSGNRHGDRQRRRGRGPRRRRRLLHAGDRRPRPKLLRGRRDRQTP